MAFPGFENCGKARLWTLTCWLHASWKKFKLYVFFVPQESLKDAGGVSIGEGKSVDEDEMGEHIPTGTNPNLFSRYSANR
jgi:hypothetical protein